MKIDIEDKTVEIDDKLVELYNQCMKRCTIQKSNITIIYTPSGKSKFYDIFKKYSKAKHES